MAILYINYTTEYGNAPSQVSVNIEDEGTFTFTNEYLPVLTTEGYQFDGWMLDGSFVCVGDISNVISVDTTLNLVAHWTKERNYWGNATGGFGYPKTFILTDESGAEFTGVVVDQLTVFTATDDDVREGAVYASDKGVSTGTKVIPIYHAREGKKVVMANKELSITIEEYDIYDYTYLQCIVCEWDTSIPLSVVDIYKVIDSNLYQTGSNVVLQSVTKDIETKSIKLGVTNTGGAPVVIRYCVYKEA